MEPNQSILQMEFSPRHRLSLQLTV